MEINILDTFNSSSDDEGGDSGGDSGVFTLQYGTESVTIKLGGDEGSPETLEAALNAYATELGFDRSRTVTFRHGSEILSASTAPEAGASYVASVQHEAKG